MTRISGRNANGAQAERGHDADRIRGVIHCPDIRPVSAQNTLRVLVYGVILLRHANLVGRYQLKEAIEYSDTTQASLKIPAGTPNGKMMRLRGKGVASIRGGGAGDLVARIVFEVPQYLTGRQRGLLEDLAKTLDASNFPESRSFAEKVKMFYSHKDKLTKK